MYEPVKTSQNCQSLRCLHTESMDVHVAAGWDDILHVLAPIATPGMPFIGSSKTSRASSSGVFAVVKKTDFICTNACYYTVSYFPISNL